MTMEQILIQHAVDSVLSTCGNSYVNAYTQAWLEAAKRVGVYHGRTTGNLQEVRDEWSDYLDQNGGFASL